MGSSSGGGGGSAQPLNPVPLGNAPAYNPSPAAAPIAAQSVGGGGAGDLGGIAQLLAYLFGPQQQHPLLGGMGSPYPPTGAGSPPTTPPQGP